MEGDHSTLIPQRALHFLPCCFLLIDLIFAQKSYRKVRVNGKDKET